MNVLRTLSLFVSLLSTVNFAITSGTNDRYKDNHFRSKVRGIPYSNITSPYMTSSSIHNNHSLVRHGTETTSATTALDLRQGNAIGSTKPEMLEPEVLGRIKPEVFGFHDGPSEEIDYIMRLMHAVAKQMAGLKSVVHHLKVHNQMIYKQMKKAQNKCLADMVADDPNRHNTFNNSPAGGLYLKSNFPSSRKSCPRDFEYSKEMHKCYKFATTRVTWRVARERCQVDNAELVSIETAKEQRYIMERARKDHETTHCDFWIGLTKKTPDHRSGWYWVEHGGALSYSNWNYQEPNNGNGYEHCTQMLWIFKWKWNDASCNHGNACYICQQLDD